MALFSDAVYLPLLLTGAGALLAALPAARRLPFSWLAGMLAALPAAAFAWLLAQMPAINAGAAPVWRAAWLPSLGVELGFRLDGLALLFALLVTGIGALVVLYTGFYFSGKAGAWRFLSYLFLFMSAMLALVLAGDAITLFVAWEGTSVVSFLLVGYKSEYGAARRGAFKALLITAGGGVALLVGLLLMAAVAGTIHFEEMVAAGGALRASALYPAILGLVALGAFTKSAQFPFHIWLPDAMSAPTPASAYLHSATMVKAGIYLLARLHPALGQTELWFWMLGGAGLVTMVAGAYLGFKQDDLKALLAYSTISQLGALVLLVAQDTEIAFKALIIGVTAHALYKSALFLAVGSVDHQAGSRRLEQLGGLARSLPFTFGVAAVAALSMAGLPPLLGFLAKETLLATAVHPSLPAVVAPILPLATVAAGALLLAQAGLLVGETFLGPTRTPAREAPAPMWMAPAVPALLSLGLGILPEPAALAMLFAGAAEAAYGAPVKVSLALWTGLNVPLLLSGVVVLLGSSLFLARRRVRAAQKRLAADVSLNGLFQAGLEMVDRGGRAATRVQQGRLRFYLLTILSGALALVVLFGRSGLLAPLPTLSFSLAEPSMLLRLLALATTGGAALATVFLRRDFNAILAFGAVGLGVTILMALEPAPDVALVQVVVDVLALVILALTLTRLPLIQRRRAQAATFAGSRRGLLRDGLVAAGVGLVAASLSLAALTSRPRASAVTPFYEANARPLTGASDIVGAIIVDFRALDTLVEIAVFSMVGLGIYTLLRHAVDVRAVGGNSPPEARSPLIRALAYLALPLAMMIAVTHMLYGHDRPGDGFTAGVLIGLAVAFWYVVFGYEEIKRRLRWLRPAPLIGSGLLLNVGVGAVAAAVNGTFLAPVDFNTWLGLPLPAGIKLSSGFLFEIGICFTVLGGTAYILNTLGHPEGAARTAVAEVKKTADLARYGTDMEPAAAPEPVHDRIAGP